VRRGTGRTVLDKEVEWAALRTTTGDVVGSAVDTELRRTAAMWVPTATASVNSTAIIKVLKGMRTGSSMNT
jgi:hypothetical protein